MENLAEQNKEQFPNLKKVFIELGSGDIPVSWIGKKKFRENKIYIGIDINPEDLNAARDMTAEKRKENKNVYFVRSDILELPVGNRSADEVFLGNVVGDPSIKNWEKDKFIEEAKRILKPGGRIIIKETNAPADLRYLDKLIKRHGLAVEKGATPKDPTWTKLIEPYSEIEAKSKWSESYIVFLKPETIPEKEI